MDNSETNEAYAQRMRTRRGEAPLAPKRPFGFYRVSRGRTVDAMGTGKLMATLWLVDKNGNALVYDRVFMQKDRVPGWPVPTKGKHHQGIYVFALHDDEVPSSWFPYKHLRPDGPF